MDLRTRTALFCAALALAIAISVLLRARVRATQALFAAFAANVGLWYLTQGLFGVFQNRIWGRATELLAVLLPQLAVRLFVAIVPREPSIVLGVAGVAGSGPHPRIPSPESERSRRLVRVTTACAIPMFVLIASPFYERPAARIALFVYFAGLTGAGLYMLALEGASSASRAVRQRSRFIAVVGALAAVFTLADFLWWVPVGAVLSIVFLFVLAQSFQSPRLLDLYDLAGRLLVATALAFCIGGIFWVFVWWVGRFNTMYLNAVLASIAILVLLGPLQQAVEARIHQLFFREREGLETAVLELRRRLAHVLETREMVTTVLAAFEGNRRVTSAAVFLREGLPSPGGAAYVLEGHIGKAPRVVRVEEASARAFLDRLGRGAVVREEVEREVSEAIDARDPAALAQSRDLHGKLDDIGAGVAIGFSGEELGRELAGFVVVVDDRVRDAFSPEEIALFEGLAGQMATVIENTRVYARVKERDRLTALGAMAAGLAHEVKNPLGAIKGAAQLIAEQTQHNPPDVDPEFVGIILEEVERLDRVVGSILDYARPRADEAMPIDVNAAVRRTMQILAPAHDEHVDAEVVLAESLPQAKIDPEQLRQVLMNLVKNAVQAMGGSGRVTVSTAYRRASRDSPVGAPHGAVEIRVADTGPGISTKVLKNLFIPFFTTKSTGTGLGLAISQRIVQNAGGIIDVQSATGVGTTFTIVLPASAERAPTSAPGSGPSARGSQAALA